MNSSVSVIICTHNPRPDFLRRVLDALKAQMLPKEQWELLLVDNASKEPLANVWDLSWHSNGRHIREEELGLTAARLRGIRESGAELLVFVDDDNVLAANYLSEAFLLAREQAWLGVFSGRVLPEFETPPEAWLKNYLPHLANRDFDRDAYTDKYFDWSAMPLGAGLCLRRAVALRYVEICRESRLRKQLDRTGASLNSGGDIDLAMVGLDLGYKIGLSVRLVVTHLIPNKRCSREYIIKLMEAISFSNAMVQEVRSPVGIRYNVFRDAASCLKNILTRRGIEQKVYFAQRRGHAAFRRWKRKQPRS
jgi:glycosyltransferase involved in cell wall biosynthesis